jgi:hypothetical protein
VEALERNEDARLDLVRARAEKWVAGVGALSGVLATGLVIKGPDDATRVVLGWRIVAAGLIGLAVGLLAYATFRAYRAAFGEPDALREGARYRWVVRPRGSVGRAGRLLMGRLGIWRRRFVGRWVRSR